MVIDFYAIYLKKKCKTFKFIMVIDVYAIYFRKKMQKWLIYNDNENKYKSVWEKEYINI